jgi:seryl-tRNA synthetase|tara:strand:+ start:1994 stop:3277 length:1284 start_codon:yes stop_codon:yes gene_type:complete
MVDIKDLREHPEIYKANNKKKARDVNLIEDVLDLDKKWRKLKFKEDDLRSERNKISEKINKSKKEKNEKKAKELIKKAKEIPEKLNRLNNETKETYKKLKEELSKIPTLMEDNVPIGKSDKENVVRKIVGKPPKFNFPIKNHVELIEDLDIGDFDVSGEVSGKGFYYLKNDLGLLNQALIQFTINFMQKNGYTYIEPPLVVHKKIAEAAEDFEAFKTKIYKVEDEDLYLIPTAEHSILGMMIGKTTPEEKLPLKFFGYSMCFRREIGSHGIDEKGLWRTHQFNKIEQFIFCHPKDSWKYYDELKKNSEEIMKKLKLPYRIFESCTGDLGDWKAKGEDLEVWRPTTKSYGEVGSLSNCVDSQAIDLNIKGINKKGERYVLHTLNNTAVATSRIMVAILENFQQKDGSIKIPKVLWPYMNGKKKIEVKK